LMIKVIYEAEDLPAQEVDAEEEKQPVAVAA